MTREPLAYTREEANDKAWACAVIGVVVGMILGTVLAWLAGGC